MLSLGAFPLIGFLCLLLKASIGAASDSAESFRSEYQRPKKIPYPRNNPHSQAKEELGKKLFFDPRISGSQWISCNTCHNAGMGWEDGLPLGFGHGMQRLKRHTPTILNLAWGELFFWDGRATTLEEQALLPISSEAEMNMSTENLVAQIKKIKGYAPYFKGSFPKEKDPITRENIGKAIATFERTIVSGTAPFDRWVKGRSQAISNRAKRGFILFNTKARCMECHSSWRFTDDGFHDIGIKDNDRGRGKIMDLPILQNAFKTPTLRNISRRAPYMHDGSIATLLEVVEFYNRGGDAYRDSKSDQIIKLGLSESEKRDLIEFLNSLTSTDAVISYPKLPM